MSLCFYFFQFFFLPLHSTVCSLLVLSTLFPIHSPAPAAALCGVSLVRLGIVLPRKYLFPRPLSDICASTDFLYKFIYFKLIFYCQSSSQKGFPVGGGRGSEWQGRWQTLWGGLHAGWLLWALLSMGPFAFSKGFRSGRHRVQVVHRVSRGEAEAAVLEAVTLLAGLPSLPCLLSSGSLSLPCPGI